MNIIVDNLYFLDNEVKEIVENLVSKHEVFETPNHNFIVMSKTSFRRGRFYGNKNGSGRVVVTVDYIDGEGNHVVYNDEYLIDKDNALGAIACGLYLGVDILSIGALTHSVTAFDISMRMA